MSFAVLLDLVGHGLDAPVLAVEERAPVIRENRAEMLHEPLGLRVGNILARDHHMLVKRHVVSTSVKAHFIGRAIPFRCPSTRVCAVHICCERLAAYTVPHPVPQGRSRRARSRAGGPRRRMFASPQAVLETVLLCFCADATI